MKRGPIFLGWLFIWLGTSIPCAAVAAPTKHALLVGVTRYSSLDEEHQLEGPANDVRIALKMLGQKGFEPSHILVFADHQPGAQKPTRENIMAGLEIIADRVQQGDFVYLQFSGHGSRELANAVVRIDTGKQSKELTLNVKKYHPQFQSLPPTPYTAKEGETTRDNPARWEGGSYLEITLPGELREGWSFTDGLLGSGMSLQRIEQLFASGNGGPHVKLTFILLGSSLRDMTSHLLIRRGSGIFGGKSFDFYFRITPARVC